MDVAWRANAVEAVANVSAYRRKTQLPAPVVGEVVQLSHFYDVSEANDLATLERNLVGMAHRLDFGLVNATMVVESQGDQPKASMRSIGNTPKAYLEAQLDPAAGARDPVLALFKRLSVPFIYDQTVYAASDAMDLWEEQAAFGYKTGVGVALHLPDRQHFLLGIDRTAALPSDDGAMARLMADLQLLAMHASAACQRLLLPTDDAELPALKPREIEVLQWAAAGKTAWETGKILGISEEGVNYHVKNVLRKWDVPTKHLAVLRASRLGLISI